MTPLFAQEPLLTICSDRLSPYLEISVPPIEQERKLPSTVSFEGTLKNISIGVQFLAWIAATFRTPKKGVLSCSTVAFAKVSGDLKFSLKVSELWTLNNDQGTCWEPLFPSTIMAYGFPVPSCYGFVGLRIPVDIMFQLSDVVSAEILEDEKEFQYAVCFQSVRWSLYPTEYNHEEKALQWHIIKRTTRQIFHPYTLWPPERLPGLLKGLDLDTMADATAILGYCQRVFVQLGTQSRLEQYAECRPSNARYQLTKRDGRKFPWVVYHFLGVF